MANPEIATENLNGSYRDVLRAPDGGVLWDSGVRRNTIVVDCRRLLAGFMHGAPTATLGLQRLLVGAGDASWDAAPVPPNAAATALVDAHPFALTLAPANMSYLDGSGAVVGTVTNRLQIRVQFGPGQPNWPGDGFHAAATLREFGLSASLEGAPVLINCVHHAAIPKDPVSTLERTIWLVF